MPAARKRSPEKSRSRKPTLSPTRIAIYLECAVKYKYVYIDKIGKFYLRARPGYSFGSSLHRVLQQFHQDGESLTAEDLVAGLEQRWVSAGYETEEEEQRHRETGQQIVQAYHAAHQERMEAQVETLATEKTLSYDMGAFKLSGRVDRIDRHADGSLEIIDYKSGRLKTTPEEVAGDLAMTIYQLLLKRQHPDVRVFATLYCLRTGVSASAELSKEAMDQFEQDLRVLGAEILERDYTDLAPVPMDICADCEFFSRCLRIWKKQK